MKKLCLKGFLGLYRLWSKAFLLMFYFEQVACHISVDARLHNWCFAPCGHFYTSQRASGVSILHGLALAFINYRNASCCFFFCCCCCFCLMVGYTRSALWHPQSQMSSILTFLSSLLSLTSVLKEYAGGKQGALNSYSLPLLSPDS